MIRKLTISLSALILIFTAFHNAKAEFQTDNFDDYSVSDSVVSKSRWANDGVLTIPSITNSNCVNGNCVDMNKTTGVGYEFEATTTSVFPSYGQFYFYQQYANTAGSDFYFRFQHDSTILDSLKLRNVSGSVKLQNDLGDNIFTTATGTVHFLQWQYSQVNNQIRYNLDYQGFSPWANLSSTINKFTITSQNVSLNGIRTFDEANFSNTPILLDNISFVLPENQSTVKDFDFWTLNYQTSSSTSIYTINVQYGRSTSTIDYIDSETIPYSENPVQWKIQKQNLLPEGDWYAQAFLYKDDNLIDYTSQIGFLIDNTNGQDITYGYSPGTSTVNSLTATCDPTSNIFSYSICSMFNFLFVPRTSSLNRFTGIKTVIQNKPPFGYMTVALNKLNTVSTTTTSNLIPQRTIFDDFLSSIRLVTTYLLYFLFLFYLVKRFRKFIL